MLTKRADISSIRGPRRIYSGRLVSKSDRLLDKRIAVHPKANPQAPSRHKTSRDEEWAQQAADIFDGLWVRIPAALK
jgi:hypothetical protein